MKKKLLVLNLMFFYSFIAISQSVAVGDINDFIAKTGAKSTYDKATSNLNFIRFPADRPLTIDGETPSAKALAFMSQNKGLFPIKRGDDSHEVKESIKDNYGMDHVFLQQYYKGVPVFDGLLKFHFNKNVQLTSFNGNYIKVEKLNPIPNISKVEAEQIAIKYVDGIKLAKISAPLKVNKSNLFVFQKGLVQGYKGSTHLVYEVEVRNDREIREFVYIDAHTKALIEQFSGIHESGLDRKLYETNYNSAAPATNLTWTEGETLPDPDGAGPRAALDVWQLSEVETAGQMYYMMKNAFGHGSYNGGLTLATESPMITVNNDPGIACPNANWNGTTANYCTGVAADDVVAHEWGHAYTEYTSNLIYAWQSGALNESYSDVWGETVDQLNSYFDGGEVAGNKWQMGEQSTSFGGAIRNMMNPNQFGDPGKVTDAQYHCATTDAGGVHINSGIPNHAYALLVDGGTYNGQTITGLGMTKAAHIWWYAQRNFMTMTTDFAAQADNLEAALTALIGIDLYSLSTTAGTPTLSGISITAGDLAELQKALLAVEMRAENNCGFVALLQPLAPLCGGGLESNAIYFENFEDGLTGWTPTNAAGSGSNWTSHDWVADTSAPDGRIGTVAFGVNTNAGDCDGNQQNGVISLTSPIITIPANTTAPELAFDHYVSMELGWDGGNIQVSVGGGAFANVPAAAFIANGYNATLNTPAQGNNNPLASQQAFTGADGGSVSGSWGQSRINLLLLTGGLVVDNSGSAQTVQFRWRVGQDGCSGWDGWYIDDVRVYSCAAPTVQFVDATTTVNEGEAITANSAPNECLPYIEKIVSIKINKAPSLPVTVTMNAPTGTAKMGSTADYSFTPNSVILQAGTLSQDVTVRIYNDAYVEGNENFTLTYALSGGGDASPELINQSHTITITDDDEEPGVVVTDLINENFESAALPTGWNGFNGDGVTADPTEGIGPDSWFVNTEAGFLDPTGSNYLIANSDFFGPGFWDKIIETAPVNTLGSTVINLSFLEFFRVYTGAGDAYDEVGTVEVYDGTTWHNVLTHTEAGGTIGSALAPFNRQISIPIAYSNAAMKVRFRYTADWDYFWAIDNVKLSASLPTQVQSTVNTANPAEAYLGPNETAVFYDPTTGDLLAKIKNLSAFDYGCTTVEVDRAGNGQVPWFGPYMISQKTFKVTPTTNNPTGEYEISFYFKNAEIAGNTINSMGKTSLNSMGNNVAYASGQAGSVFNTDYSYTATFDSGFSGFGLSDAQPVVGPLPVKLISFEGSPTIDGNQLTWVTTEEKNNEAFVLERSENAKDFKAITQIKGNGNSKEKNSYEYLDNTYLEGINYYRLKQLDNDGKYGFSKVIVLESKNAYRINILPNPVAANLNIEVPFADDVLVDFKIVSNIGAEMLNKQVKAKNGKIIQEMNGFAPGIYHIILKAKDKTSNYKIIKQ
jgi:Zn-dependent metalloprotease